MDCVANLCAQQLSIYTAVIQTCVRQAIWVMHNPLHSWGLNINKPVKNTYIVRSQVLKMVNIKIMIF